MDIHYSTTEGGANQNWMDVDVKGAAFKTFHFKEVVNEWPQNGRIIETPVRIWSFWFYALYVSKLGLIVSATSRRRDINPF